MSKERERDAHGGDGDDTESDPPDAPGDRPTDDAQGDRPTDDARGDRPTDDAQGDRPTDDAQGDRPTDDAQGDRPPVVERDAVANTFVDAAPQTLPEIAEETGLERETVEGVLEDLVDDEALATKELATDAATLRVWYLPASEHVERLASGSPAPPRADAVADAVSTMDVPGVSEMMQDWRRDAIREAWEFVADQGAVTDDAIVDAVYPGHSAGYEDRDNWWDCVRPRLADLPGITAPSDGDDDVWTYTPA